MNIVYGGLYRVNYNAWSNDQSYNLAVPIPDDKGNVWMQDTYQLGTPSMKKGENRTDAKIREIVELFKPGYDGWAVTKARRNYYHKNQMIVHNQNELDNNFEFICDLRDYEKLIGQDGDYSESDLIRHVKLYFEHGYSCDYGPIGVTLVRKGAKKKNDLILKRMIRDFNSEITLPDVPFGYEIELDNIEIAACNCKKEGIDISEELEKIERLKAASERLKEMNAEIIDILSW